MYDVHNGFLGRIFFQKTIVKTWRKSGLLTKRVSCFAIQTAKVGT